jgi:hypothetical protein
MVQKYKTKDEALTGHKNWIRKMNIAPRPEELYDVQKKIMIKIR